MARSLPKVTVHGASYGFRHARLNALASAAAEMAIGFGLILGILTSFSAAGLIATVTVTFLLAVLGPGSISVDSTIGIADTFYGWIGAAVAAGAVGLGTAHAAAMWRRPAAGNRPTVPGGKT